ncbi:MAG: hypothetical protein ACRCU1_05680 [Alsobacter sp.]
MLAGFAGLKGMLLAGGLAALVTGGFAYKLGHDSGLSRAVKMVSVERDKITKAATKVIDGQIAEMTVLKAELAQARGEVVKVNTEILRQLEEQKTLLTADAEARQAASIRVEAAARQAAVNAKEAGARAQAAMEVIRNVADQCARAGVPPDVVRVLNDILSSPNP